MRKAIGDILYVLIVLAFIDIVILFTGLTQIALENNTGHWAPFWRVQAEFIINLL